MSEPRIYPLQLHLPGGQPITGYALLPGPQPSAQATPLPGHLCEQCLDAPAVAVVPAPWGGDMGVCEACQGRDA